MRLDETGSECPATLGEYRDLCKALGGEECDAVRWLDSRIANEGRDARVFSPDAQMRALLMPMLITVNGEGRPPI